MQNKYKKLEPPCDKCLGCIRLENSSFISDKNCKYAEKENWKQEEIWKTK